MKYFIDTEFIEGFKRPISWLPTIGSFNKPYHSVQLISIGIIAEDGRNYYAISNEFNPNDADDWVKKNVIAKLDSRGTYRAGMQVHASGAIWKCNKQIAKEIIDFVNPKIQDLIDKFTRHDCWNEKYYPKEFEYIKLHNTKIPDNYYKSGSNGYLKNRELIYNHPEFYAYYADYDWVVFCSLFGRMINLPKGFPMYCIDLKQTLDEKVSTFSNSDFFTKFHLEKEMTLSEKLKELKKHTSYPQQENEHNALADAEWNKKLYEFLNKL